MKILFIADARSPIALNWIGHFINSPNQIHLISTFPADRPPGLSSFKVIPVAFSSAAASPGSGGGSIIRKLTSPQLRTLIRQFLGVLTIDSAAKQMARLINQIQPDIVHAMRIPYEGMTAAKAFSSNDLSQMKNKPPLLISIWGNDFTLHAKSNTIIGKHTRKAMDQASAIHADCHRDIRLASSWGFSENKPFTVLPGSGGVQTDIFYPPKSRIVSTATTIVQPRGLRAYVQNEAFFRAIPLVLEKHPQVHFVCPAMKGEIEAENWVKMHGITHAVSLMPKLSRREMADLFRKSEIMLSPTTHDGTPNTLLEALACGCFPVAGDVESIHEWIKNKENGLIVDARDPDSIAAGLLEAIERPELRAAAESQNVSLIRKKATFQFVMQDAENFYKELTR